MNRRGRDGGGQGEDGGAQGRAAPNLWPDCARAPHGAGTVAPPPLPLAAGRFARLLCRACQLRVSAVQAEAIARKNDLSVIDLLRPFANVDTSNVAINTTREQVRACALAYFRALAGTRALARARRPAYE